MRQSSIIQFISVWAILLFTGGFCAGAAEFAGGTGEPNDPYRIATAEQLISIGMDPNLLNKHYVLVADIDLDPNRTGGCVFEGAVIAGYDSQADVVRQFTGSLDGHGHAIYGLTMRVPSPLPEAWRCDDRVGLFGTIGTQGRVANLSVVDANIVTETSSLHAAIMVGFNSGDLDNCSVSGSVSSGTAVGGFVGYNEGNVMRCTSQCTVDARTTAGGISGSNGGILYECVSSGTVTTANGLTGGLVGGNDGTISSCRRYGVTNGRGEYTGGLIAFNDGTLEYCTHVGTVNGRECTGGLVGTNFSNGVVFHCQSNAMVSGEDGVGGGCAENRGHLVECSSEGYVQGVYAVGGFVGWNSDDRQIDNSHIEACLSNSGVVGTERVGGFVGDGGRMADCYCTGMVRGQTSVGGFGGITGGNTHCYSASVVHAVLPSVWPEPGVEDINTYFDYNYIGGFAGINRSSYGDDIGCFWDVELSGHAESDGGIPMTTAQMQLLDTYLEASWDFVDENANGQDDVWTLPQEGIGYPRLMWECICSD